MDVGVWSPARFFFPPWPVSYLTHYEECCDLSYIKAGTPLGETALISCRVECVVLHLDSVVGMRDGCTVAFAKRNNIPLRFYEYKEAVFLVVTERGLVRGCQRCGVLMVPTLKTAAVGSFATMLTRTKVHAVLTQSSTVIIFYSCGNITFLSPSL
jgi:hypothetical protein